MDHGDLINIIKRSPPRLLNRMQELTHKLILDVLGGKARVLSFDNVASGPDRDITTGALSALNFVRLAFAAARNSPLLSQILASLCSRQTVENALAICREWHSDVHLEAEDVYHIPLFEASLKLVSSDDGLPLLQNLRLPGSSAAILVARFPHVVACLRFQASAQEVFVLFNPRVSSEHQQVASLTFCSSLLQITQLLSNIFPQDEIHLTRANLDQQAKSPEKCARLVFVPRANCSHGAQAGEESLIVASLTLLSLRADLEELCRDNGSLKQETRRLKQSAIDIAARLEEERERNKRNQSSKSSVTKVTRGPPVVPSRGSQCTRPSPSTRERQYFIDEEEEDPDIRLALQLQAAFDSENESLLKQKHELVQTSQRQYHCGICLEDFPEDDAVHVDACGHEICRVCVRGHVCSKIEEHRFPVLCPVCMANNKIQNPGTIPGTLVQLLGVSEEQWTTWVEMEIAQFSISISCRKCHHSGFVDRADLETNSEIHCPFSGCDHVWCKKCQQTIEAGGPEHSCDGTTELDHLVKQQGWRYCPNCKTPIQKTHGCNHLSCIAPGCNTHFCYRCGKLINRTAIPAEILQAKMDHFRTCSLMG